MNKVTILSVLIIGCLLNMTALNAQSDRTVWTKVSQSKLDNASLYARKSMPSPALFYSFNASRLRTQLLNAPLRSNLRTNAVLVSLPTSTGVEQFEVKQAGDFEPALQAAFPNIRSYVGKSTGDSNTTVRFTLTPQGLHAIFFNPESGMEYIDPYTTDNLNYIVYKRSALPSLAIEFNCEFDNAQVVNNSTTSIPKNANDGTLRSYRMAIATTIEYSEFHWMRAGIGAMDTTANKRAAVVAAIAVTLARNNFVYERDLSITMVLVANNDQVVFIDADNLTNNNSGALIGEIQQVIDFSIGFNNYDLGHVFSTGQGGIAALSSPCTNNKARGVTGLPQPIGDPYDIDYVAHEVGHQFGSPHTFNGTAGSCAGGSRSANFAYEPASGTTIMAYAGICPPQNVQNNSDAYFHQVSLQAIYNNVRFGNSTCSSNTVTGNVVPVALAGIDYTIPSGTPYKLTGNSTDANGTASHTFTWEQYNLGPAGLPAATNTQGPLVRSFEGTTSPTRFIPNLPDLLTNGGVSTTYEVLATVNRNQNFRLTVRDNDSRGGNTATDIMSTSVVAAAGPFRVTSQDAAGIIWLPNTTETVTWDVAGTTGNGVNTSTVNILLSTDGGLTFDQTLATAVPNNGSADITVPAGIVSNTCRLMVEGNGNIFFNVNDTEFNINAQVNTVCNTYSSGAVNLAIPDGAGNNQQGQVLSSTINIPASATIVDARINVDIAHTYIQDLVFQVTNPNGDTVTLWNRDCVSEDDIDVTFQDGAGAIVCASPTVGTYDAAQPLSGFNGSDSMGDWMFLTADFFNGDSGTLNEWSVTLCTTTITPLSNDDVAPLTSLEVYPNPATQLVNVNFENDTASATTIDIYDLAGKILFSKNYEASASFSKTVDVGGLSQGLYLIKISSANKSSTRKFVKQ